MADQSQRLKSVVFPVRRKRGAIKPSPWNKHTHRNNNHSRDNTTSGVHFTCSIPHPIPTPLPPQHLWKSVHIGVSFVRQFKHHILKPFLTPEALGPMGGDQFVDIASPQHAALFSQQLRLDTKYSEIYTCASRVSYIHDLHDKVPAILHHRPDNILVFAGTNKLSRFMHPPSHLQLTQLANSFKQLAGLFPPNVPVIVMGVVPRTGNIKLSPQDFRSAMRGLNDIFYSMEKQALAGDQSVPPNFRYHSMLGWDKSQVNGHFVDLSPSDWCDIRGIHPTEEAYKDKYLKSVRSALLLGKNMPPRS